MKSIQTLIVLATMICFPFQAALAQENGQKVVVQVMDSTGAEALPFVNVVLSQDSVIKSAAATDFEGNAVMFPIQPGNYNLRVHAAGYVSDTVQVNVRPGMEKVQVNLNKAVLKIEELQVVQYTVPLIDANSGYRGCCGGPVYREMSPKEERQYKRNHRQSERRQRRMDRKAARR